LTKILGGQTKILWGKVVKSDKCMGVSQLLGARARAALSKVYAYAKVMFPNIRISFVTINNAYKII